VSRPRVQHGSYGWPVKPFDRQHAVRGFFNDPRIGEGSESFHFGIDVAAPNRTPVYAVAPGHADHLNSRAVGVYTSPGRGFEYWHVVPVIRPGTSIRLHQLLGYVEKPWAHVHFAEVVNGEYVNPLRRGGLGPFLDDTAPTIAAVGLARRDRALASAAVGSRVDLVVDAFDTTPIRVQPEWWADLPVTPVLLRWRLVGRRGVVVNWTNGVDSRYARLQPSRYREIYGSRTRQNHPRLPGRYCFHLARGWSVGSLHAGTYTLEVQAWDTGGNHATAATVFRIR
jgi:hypothetical protein